MIYCRFVKAVILCTWYSAPVVYCLFMAYSVSAQTLPLGEENRRIIERQEERIEAMRQAHTRDINDVERRMGQVEGWIFYLFLASGASPAIVGLDKAGYWIKKRNSSK